MDKSFVNTTLFDELLETGRSILNLQVGIVSKVYGSSYELIAIADLANEFKPGEVLQLEATYCRDVITSGKTIALTEIDGVTGLQKHPLYAANTLEAYIGAPLFLNGNVWGTINYSSMVLRPSKFTLSETALVEAYAGLVSASLQA